MAVEAVEEEDEKTKTAPRRITKFPSGRYSSAVTNLAFGIPFRSLHSSEVEDQATKIILSHAAHHAMEWTLLAASQVESTRAEDGDQF